MKIVVRHPNGSESTFEGTEEEFTKASDLIPGFADGFRVDPERARPRRDRDGGGGQRERDHEDEGDDDAHDDADDDDADLHPRALDPTQVDARLSEVNASTDIERVTVMAQAAMDAGYDGLDYETVTDLYRRLALRMPGKWRSTFSNAQNRGYVYSAGRNKWKTTPAGENFARLGIRVNRPRGRRPRSVAAGVEES